MYHYYVCFAILCVCLHVMPTEKKRYTFLAYIAAANDLYLFADRNIEQMKQIGSNHLLNILVFLTVHKPNSKKITKKLLIHKNKVTQIGPDLCLDSGSEKTLLHALQWAHDEFPADFFIFDFWNHGSGDLSPLGATRIRSSQLFYYNPATKLIELNRSLGYFDLIDKKEDEAQQRGVCFDESDGSYLNDQKISYAFSQILERYHKKVDVILFDACLMAGIGTGWLMHNYAHYMVASEEVALGPGYDYALVLAPLATQPTIDPRTFAIHVVSSYEKIYRKVTQDYTQSAFDLSKIALLSENVDTVAQLLIQAIRVQRNNSVKQGIRQSMLCLSFDEPSYRDLGHFYAKLKQSYKSFQYLDKSLGQEIFQKLGTALDDGLHLIADVVIANAAGKKMKDASGIYIYLPQKKIHPSYQLSQFAQQNCWKHFLETLLD